MEVIVCNEKNVLLVDIFRKGDIILGKTIIYMYKTEYVDPKSPDACTPLPKLNTNPFVFAPNIQDTYYADNGENIIYDIIRDNIRYRLIAKGEEAGFDFDNACVQANNLSQPLSDTCHEVLNDRPLVKSIDHEI